MRTLLQWAQPLPRAEWTYSMQKRPRRIRCGESNCVPPFYQQPSAMDKGPMLKQPDRLEVRDQFSKKAGDVVVCRAPVEN